LVNPDKCFLKDVFRSGVIAHTGANEGTHLTGKCVPNAFDGLRHCQEQQEGAQQAPSGFTASMVEETT